MQWLAELCVKRPVFATVLSLVILVVGSVFYLQLGVDQFPKIEIPVVLVSTIQPGSSPEDMEREVSDKIEGAVNTISGIDELRSTSAEGVSQVIIQFVLEKNVDVASQEVQQKVSAVMADLPKGIDAPTVLKFEPDATPVIFIALRAPGKTVREITDIADRVVRRRLESVNGVGKAALIGGRKREIQVMADPVKLKALGVSPLEVAGAINAQNITLPGGRVDTSRDYLTLRVNGRVESVDELRAIIIRDTTGRSIRLDELAEVVDGVQDADTGAMWNGERTVLLAISKQSGTNTVAVVDAIKERMLDVQKELPAGFILEVQRDGSAWRMSARDIADLARDVEPVMQQLLRYTQALFTHMAQTSACHRHHALAPQLCRWLLQHLDRQVGDEMLITHERIAGMLGVRREGVTGAALQLQRAGLIHYRRGHIRVLNRHGLEQHSCECYSVVERAYEQLRNGSSAWPRPTGATGRVPSNEGGRPAGLGAPTASALANAAVL